MPTQPPFFEWILPGCLAAMARPVDLNASLESLREQSVDVIVTLTERGLRTSLVEEFGFEYHHLPVRDFHAPTQRQIEKFVEIVNRARGSGRRVVVHCQAGTGRTGTMVAAYLVALGRTAQEAMDELRARRPGSIETAEQEEAVRSYEESLRRHP